MHKIVGATSETLPTVLICRQQRCGDQPKLSTPAIRRKAFRSCQQSLHDAPCTYVALWHNRHPTANESILAVDSLVVDCKNPYRSNLETSELNDRDVFVPHSIGLNNTLCTGEAKVFLCGVGNFYDTWINTEGCAVRCLQIEGRRQAIRKWCLKQCRR